MISGPGLLLLAPPYDRLLPVHARDVAATGGVPGTAIVWRLHGRVDDGQLARVRDRPGGVSLILVLPEPGDLKDRAGLLRVVEHAYPCGILPFHEDSRPDELAQVLRVPPGDLAAAVTEYLRWRGIELDRGTRHLVRRTVELSDTLRSVTALSRSLYMSRRALGRRLLARGLPVPSHWLHFSRLLRVLIRLQNTDDSVVSVAYRLGYADGFALSNQMMRLVGYRPTDARRYLGWQWFMEAWLRREAGSGGLAPPPECAGAVPVARRAG